MLNEDRYVDAATRTADALIEKMRPDGFLREGSIIGGTRW